MREIDCMENNTEMSYRVFPVDNTKGHRNIIFKLASYTSQALQAQVELTTKSLGMAAAVIDTSNESDLRRWNRLAKLATELVDARLGLRVAMVNWSDVVEDEDENRRRAGALLAAVAEFDEVTKIFNDFGAHF